MKKKSWLLVIKLLFLLSICVLVYSLYQVISAPYVTNDALEEWDTKRQELTIPAGEMNEVPVPDGLVSIRKDTRSPAQQLTVESGEVFGELYIPRLKRRLALVEGTDHQSLKKGVGHYQSSHFPGEAGNSVFAGHRDTVFRGLGSLEAGDRLELETRSGRFTYEITGSVIVDEDERNAIVESELPILTLITCYPFTFVGSAPERYILSAKLIGTEGQLAP